jgi:hypothetical protein
MNSHLKLLSWSTVAALLLVARPCWAQYTVAVTASPASMGNVVPAASGDTVFHIDSNGGAVTRTSGTGARLSAGSYVGTVTVTCTSTACKTSKVNVKIQTTGTVTGHAKALTKFNVTMGTASLNTGTTSGSAPISFTLNALGLNAGKTFFVGADFPIAATGTAGDSQSPFEIGVATYNTTPSGGTLAAADAYAYPGIALHGTSPMKFGGITKSATGTGTVSMDASGAVTVTGTGLSVMPITSFPQSAAAFNAVGEAGALIAINVPASFTMTSTASGSHALTVTTVNSAASSPSLDSTGNYGFTVGGSMPIPANTVLGAYTGSLSVSVNYN